MQDFIETVAGKAVKMPSRSTMYRNVPTKFKFLEEKLMEFVKENTPGVIAIIFDIWTESGGSRRSFLNICLQFSLNFRVINISVSTSHIDGEHTGQCIADEVYAVFKKWQLTKKFIFFLRDKGSNIVLAVNILLAGLKRGESLDCVAHGLHNIIYADLKDSKIENINLLFDLVKRLRKIHKSLSYCLEKISARTNKLRTTKALKDLVNTEFIFQEVTELLAPDRSILKISNSTRWTSLYNMFNSFQKHKATVDNELLNKDERSLMLSRTHVKLMEDFLFI